MKLSLSRDEIRSQRVRRASKEFLSCRRSCSDSEMVNFRVAKDNHITLSEVLFKSFELLWLKKILTICGSS